MGENAEVKHRARTTIMHVDLDAFFPDEGGDYTLHTPGPSG